MQEEGLLSKPGSFSVCRLVRTGYLARPCTVLLQSLLARFPPLDGIEYGGQRRVFFRAQVPLRQCEQVILFLRDVLLEEPHVPEGFLHEPSARSSDRPRRRRGEPPASCPCARVPGGARRATRQWGTLSLVAHAVP